MSASDEYSATSSLSSYFVDRSARAPARLWSTEKALHDAGAVGMLDYFEGSGLDPTALPGYASHKVWLRTSSGVTAAAGEILKWSGVAPETNYANWVPLTPAGYLEHLGYDQDLPIEVIAANTTLNVPADYATISAALSYLNGKFIAPTATVTIQVADGVYSMGTGITVQHPTGDRIQIIGNTTTPASCVLRFDLATVCGVRIAKNTALGLINGFDLQCSTTIAGRLNGGAGILADEGSFVKIGTKVRVRRFWFAVVARYGGVIDARGTSSSDRVEVYDGGDAGFIALWNGVISAWHAYADGFSTVPDGDNRWGSGFIAEGGGVIDARYAVATACMWMGFGAFTNGAIWGGNLTSTNHTGGALRTGDGFGAYYGGMVDAGDSTATGNAGYGVYEDEDSNGRIVEYGTMTFSSNALGERRNRPLMYPAPPGSAAEIRATGADTNIDLWLRAKGNGQIRALSNGATVFAALGEVSSVNYLYVRGKATGSAPALQAFSAVDTNVDLSLVPQGAGLIRFGTYAAVTTEALAGFITIKDAGGTERKVAIVA